jgi:hypothetical protein
MLKNYRVEYQLSNLPKSSIEKKKSRVGHVILGIETVPTSEGSNNQTEAVAKINNLVTVLTQLYPNLSDDKLSCSYGQYPVAPAHSQLDTRE